MSGNLWTQISIKEDETISHRIGPLTVFLKKVLNEIWIGSARDDKNDGDPLPLPDKPDWNRMALPEEFSTFSLMPVFPDRPVVADSEFHYRILKNSGARIYTRIPAFVRIVPADKPDLVLAEIPTVILSETWFGIVTEGELSYALSTTVRRKLVQEMYEPHMVICPVQIENKSDEDLRFEKLCLRVERLSVYIKDDVLWADETSVMYNGRAINSDVKTAGSIPPEAKGGAIITSPIETVKTTVATRTFKLLKELHLPGF